MTFAVSLLVLILLLAEMFRLVGFAASCLQGCVGTG